jgi:hypothetical protein
MMYNSECRANRDFEGMGGINTACMSNNVYGPSETMPSQANLLQTNPAYVSSINVTNSAAPGGIQSSNAYWSSTTNNPAPISTAQSCAAGINNNRWANQYATGGANSMPLF